MRGAQRVSFRPKGSVIKYLIVANAVVFLLTSLDNTGRLTEALGLSFAGITDFQLWRLVTYMFVHGGLTHIFFNMWGLYLFGMPVEQRLGPERFLRLYFLSGIVGSGLWLLANWGTNGLLIGASGGVFGVMMAAAMSFPNMQIVLLFPPIPMRLRTFVLVYGLIEASMAWQEAAGRGGGIAHLAHLGGLLGAFFYMKRLGFQSPYNWLSQIRSAWRRRSLRMVPPSGPRPPPVPPPGGLPKDLESETDRILDKIGTHGIQSLTPEERQTLEVARERLRHRSGR